MRSGKNIFTRGGRRDRLDITQTESALRRAAQMTVWYLAVLIAFLPWRQGVCATDVTGNIDGVYYGAGQYHVNGWACATTLTQSISVDLYVGGPAGTGTMVGRYLANAPSESAVATACQSTGANYRFSITITDAIATQYYGQAIYVHGISPVGGANNLLNHSGWYTVPRPIEIVTYYHTDRLGSTVMSSDASGAITSTVDYRPYGQVVQGGKSPAPGYTGQYEDPATGLTYMRARYYDDVAMRFLSVDPVDPMGGDVYGFSRYAYALANPQRYVDPSGAQTVPTLDAITVPGYTTSLSSNGPDVFTWGGGGRPESPVEHEPNAKELETIEVHATRLYLRSDFISMIMWVSGYLLHHQHDIGELSLACSPGSLDPTTPHGRNQIANLAWDIRDALGITAKAGTTFSYVDQYRGNTNAEYFPARGAIYLYRSSAEPAPDHTYVSVSKNGGISIAFMPLNAIEAAAWAVGHEAAHSRGIDTSVGDTFHPNAEKRGFEAVKILRLKCGGYQ